MTKQVLLGVVMGLCFSFVACSDEPGGRWEAVESEEVYKNNDHPLELAFTIEKGDICAISEKWFVRKDLGYKEVVCAKGRGWITNDQHFKKIAS